MKNKKLLIGGASALSLATLGLGAFAFFTDTVELNKDAKVGTVDLEGTIEMKHTQLKRDRTVSNSVSNSFKLNPSELMLYRFFTLW